MLTRKMLVQGLPALWTERLVLRSLRQSDYSTLSELFSDPQVIRYVNRGSHPPPIRARRLLNQIRSSSAKLDSLHYGICWRGKEQVIGITSFQHWNDQNGTAQIGYILNRSCWGRGWLPRRYSGCCSLDLTIFIWGGWKHVVMRPMYLHNGC